MNLRRVLCVVVSAALVRAVCRVADERALRSYDRLAEARSTTVASAHVIVSEQDWTSMEVK
jgi:hypothetical protein